MVRESRRNLIIPLWNKPGADIVHPEELFWLRKSRFQELANDNAALVSQAIDGAHTVAAAAENIKRTWLVRFSAPSRDVIDGRVAARVRHFAHTLPLSASVDAILTTIWCKFHGTIEMSRLPGTAPPSMAEESDDLEYLVALFKQEYATLHGFLASKTREANLVGRVLQNAVVSVRSCTATPRSSEFALYVVRIVLSSLGGRRGAERTEGPGVVDLDAVLADSRELLTFTDVSAPVLEQVTNSFPSSIHREIVRRAFRAGEVNATYVSSHIGMSKRAAARIVLRANRKLRVTLAQHELRNSLLDAAVQAATVANEAFRSRTEHIEKIVIESEHATFEVDAWLVQWLQQPNPALQNQRPDELLRTIAGRQRLTHEYLRKLIRTEQDRLQLRDLLLEGARAAPPQPADAAYFERLRRMARGQ